MSSGHTENQITSWRANPADGRMTLLELLRADHEEILDLCKSVLLEIEEGGDLDSAQMLFLELKKIILNHSRAEEIIFYNAIHDYSVEAQDDELRLDIMESFEEHHMVQVLLEELTVTPLDSERWIGKMNILTETLERHIQKEEFEMFSVIQKDMAGVNAQALALEYLEEKDLLAKE